MNFQFFWTSTLTSFRGATVKFLSGAEDDASAMQRGEDMFRLLLRKGASDSMEEVAQAEAILDLDLSGCHLVKTFELQQQLFGPSHLKISTVSFN